MKHLVDLDVGHVAGDDEWIVIFENDSHLSLSMKLIYGFYCFYLSSSGVILAIISSTPIYASFFMIWPSHRH